MNEQERQQSLYIVILIGTYCHGLIFQGLQRDFRQIHSYLIVNSFASMLSLLYLARLPALFLNQAKNEV